MNFDNDILFELKNISPLLAAAQKLNVFTVPDGYFNNLSDDFFLNYAEPFHAINHTQQNLTVPEGYFNNLSQLILDKIKAQKNTSEVSAASTLSAKLLQARYINVFETPIGYFSSLSFQILNSINKLELNEKEESSGVSGILQSAGTTNIFEVPSAYFENLPLQIIDKLKAEMLEPEQENEMSSLLITARTINVFTVPLNYFEDVSTGILAALKMETGNSQLPVLLQNVQHKNIFEVPDNYFINLSAFITDKISKQINETSAEEIEALSPLLYRLQKQNVFEVPAGYFDNLTAISFSAVEPITAKVVTMPKRKLFVRLAAAAIITGVLATGIYNYTARQANTTALAANVATKNISPDSSVEKGKAMNAVQFDEALNNLSKEEVINYLEKNNSEEDMTLITASLEDSTLPDKDDYLLDEKTLDKYLDVIKSQN